MSPFSLPLEPNHDEPPHMNDPPMFEAYDLPNFNPLSFIIRNNGNPNIGEFLCDAQFYFKDKLDRAIEFRGRVQIEIVFYATFERIRGSTNGLRNLEHVSRSVEAQWVCNSADTSGYYGLFRRALIDIDRLSRQPEYGEIFSEFTVYVGDRD